MKVLCSGSNSNLITIELGLFINVLVVEYKGWANTYAQLNLLLSSILKQFLIIKW